MKGKFLAKVVSAILTATLVLGLPSGAWAMGPAPPGVNPESICTECQIEDVTFESITPTAKIGYFTDADGAKYAVALRFKQVGDEQRVYFSLLESEEDIELFKKFSRGEMQEQSRTRAPGLARTCDTTIGIGWGSWLSWNGNVLRLYVSNDLAEDMILNCAVAAVVCQVLAIVAPFLGAAPASLALEICALLTGLTAVAIDYWNDRGAPGFYICARLSPPGVWIEP